MTRVALRSLYRQQGNKQFVAGGSSGIHKTGAFNPLLLIEACIINCATDAINADVEESALIDRMTTPSAV
jgi:hypothetical protein